MSKFFYSGFVNQKGWLIILGTIANYAIIIIDYGFQLKVLIFLLSPDTDKFSRG